jgi:hypothetical protein
MHNCAHASCLCPVLEFAEYCSEWCRSRAQEPAACGCGCGHGACSAGQAQGHRVDALEELLADRRLTRQQKIARLESWSYDLRERLVATQEGMAGESKDGQLLSEVQRALEQLGAEPGGGETATQHGG